VPTTAKSKRNGLRPSRKPERFCGVSVTGETDFELFCYTAQNKHLSAIIAIVATLIIITLQLDWVNINVDIGRVSEDLLADVVSQETIWEAVGHDVPAGDIPYLIDTLNIVVDGVIYEIEAFINRLGAFYQGFTITDLANLPDFANIISASEPPDLAGSMDIFTDLVLLEVTRVTSNMGVIDQSISISSIANVIGFAELLIEMLIREGATWGMDTGDALYQRAEYMRTAEDVANMLRLIVILCTSLLIIFLYLHVAGTRTARVFGVVSIFIAALYAGIFALAIHFGNHAIGEALGDYISINATWNVYAALGLCVLSLVLIAVNRTKKTSATQYRR